LIYGKIFKYLSERDKRPIDPENDTPIFDVNISPLFYRTGYAE
jgi:hypothetical protein